MTAFNAVRFRVKPGRDQEFIAAHKNAHRDWPGLIHANLIKTGEHSYCIIANGPTWRRSPRPNRTCSRR